MNILEILSSPWAITPEKFAEIFQIYERHVNGEKADIEAIEARIGKPMGNIGHGYTVQDGVAVVPLQGVIAKRMNLLPQISIICKRSCSSIEPGHSYLLLMELNKMLLVFSVKDKKLSWE